jgi:ribosomal protein L32
MKKRHRQMAGKGLKDVTALNICSGCGHVKRAHLLCPYCVKGKFVKCQRNSHSNLAAEIQDMFRAKNPEKGGSHLPGERLVVKGAYLVRKHSLPKAPKASKAEASTKMTEAPQTREGRSEEDQ